MKIEKTKNIVICSLFVALIAVGAFIRIPIPVVPFTLQLLFTMLAGMLLGGKRGAICVCAYIGLGLFRASYIRRGGRNRIYFETKFRIYHRICCGFLCHGKNRQ